MGDDLLRVFCLCAQWCGVCREYAALFESVAADFAGRAEFSRLDIEDEADLLDPVEVENFPTVLLVRGDRVLFFGTITPQPSTLARLVEGALDGDLRPLDGAPEVDSLARRIIAAHG
jgi:thiol-disulfide isomerase/thioredoxin